MVKILGQESFDMLYHADKQREVVAPTRSQPSAPAPALAPSQSRRVERNWDILDEVQPSKL